MHRAGLLALALLHASCSVNLPVGAECSDASECLAGLSCPEDDKVDLEGKCVPQKRVCRKPCGKDADCAKLGPDWYCVRACGVTSSCDKDPTRTGRLPAGSECTRSEECHPGLACLDLGKANGMSCDPGLKTCTLNCVVDEDCTEYGDKFKCVQRCVSGPHESLCIAVP